MGKGRKSPNKGSAKKALALVKTPKQEKANALMETPKQKKANAAQETAEQKKANAEIETPKQKTANGGVESPKKNKAEDKKAADLVKENVTVVKEVVSKGEEIVMKTGTDSLKVDVVEVKKVVEGGNEKEEVMTRGTRKRDGKRTPNKNSADYVTAMVENAKDEKTPVEEVVEKTIPDAMKVDAVVTLKETVEGGDGQVMTRGKKTPKKNAANHAAAVVEKAENKKATAVVEEKVSVVEETVTTVEEVVKKAVSDAVVTAKETAKEGDGEENLK
uniref:Uncharacterized protein n=1 Tax=Physcomitrium patens TaxID=3218 RepID=A0A2K1IGL1_PHYPA|nr:hypothetical protein PHYPA_029005 [Physcomitrium patens]